MDEATSALDESTEATLYERLKTLVERENGALVSIAHRPTVAAFHNRQWLLEPQEAGTHEQGEGTTVPRYKLVQQVNRH